MNCRNRVSPYCGFLAAACMGLTGASFADQSGSSAETSGASPWSFEASIGLEYDDNLTVEELDVSSGEEDVAAVIDASLEYVFPGTSDYELEAGYDFYQSLYEDYSEFNLQSHGLFLTGSREFGDLDAGLTYRYTYSRLDNESFLRFHSLQPTLGYSVQPNWYMNLGYSYQDKKFHDESDRDGDQHALSVDNYIVFNQNKSYVRLGFRIEDEDTDGSQYDYDGYYLNGGVNFPLNLFSQTAKLDLSYQYFDKDYSSVTPSIGKDRSDRRHTFGINARVDLSDDVFANVKYEYVDAISNLPSADYDENIVTVSLGRTW